jgi:hypothetical protein
MERRYRWTRTKWILVLLFLTSLRPRLAAQQAPTPASASAADYTQTPQGSPFGARVTLETPSGTVEVHLGDLRFLAANQFAIQPGDSRRVVGEAVAYGTGSQFVARIVPKGTRALMVRAVRGVPLSYAAPRSNLNSKPQGGVL